MEITNPRRILVLGAPDAGVLSLLKGITSKGNISLMLTIRFYRPHRHSTRPNHRNNRRLDTFLVPQNELLYSDATNMDRRDNISRSMERRVQ
jgi:hypothetical protein